MSEAAARTAGLKRTERKDSGRDLASAVISIVGSALSVAGFVVLVVRAAAAVSSGRLGPGFVVGVSVYGACLIYRFIMSALAGFLPANRALRSLDEAGPFFLPGGTLMPLLFSFITGAWRWSLFGLAWAYAAGGFLMFLSILGPFRRQIVPLGYVFFFLAVPLIAPVRGQLGDAAFMWLFSGGAFYLFGFVFRGKTGFPYANAVWNAFALAGSALQYFGISSVI